MAENIVERLRSNQPMPICPFDRKSPEYWSTPDDKPCKFCGGLPEGPDKCTGADTRIMGEAAAEIAALRAEIERVWFVRCWDNDDENFEFTFTSKGEFDDFIHGARDMQIHISEIQERMTTSAKRALFAFQHDKSDRAAVAPRQEEAK